ncbi:MAG: short-chain dehydrogenase [Gammaproteobacteria bacterium]|jgi:NAD(P)-dependent dehydrogenase (short-subunit alcohol dehydrogenase family)|nr:short-chain dehydrogenase [Gammaproteobacteria bacterium]
MSQFLNKKVLVTGAASGIGEAIAKAFAAQGAFVYLTDVNEAQGQKIANEIGQAEFHYLNVADESLWQKIFSQISQLDVLVNCAGISGYDRDRGPQNPEEASLESWRAVVNINLDGVFLGCKYAIAAMKQYGGAIINISSRSGVVGTPEAAAYAASKAAVINLTKTVALYCASKNYPIRCNSILPGAILTPIWNPLLGEAENQEQQLKEFSKAIPLKCFGMPEDVAQAALFLASEASRYMTGSELVIDGGLGAGPMD